MFKTFKDARRRVVETVLENVGASEKTVDEDYDNHVAKFNSMIVDMNECGAGLHSFLVNQKTLFADAKELATSLAKIYEHNLQITDWPNSECELKNGAEAQSFKDKWNTINDVLRSSTAMVCSEQALEPLRSAVTKMGPEIDALCKERETRLKDYDSYRRRLKEKETKKESLESQGKGNTQAAIDNNAEIVKFSAKVQAGLESYTFHNEKSKTDIIAAKKAHDSLMDMLLITTIVCQAELFTQAANQLESLLQTLPEQKVKQVRARVHDYISQGGIKPVVEEKSKFQKGLAILSGKAVAADFEKSEEQVEADRQASDADMKRAVAVVHKSNTTSTAKTSSVASKSRTEVASQNPFEATGNPFELEASPPTTNESAAVPPPPPAAAQVVMVEALFDHQAEEEDELNFSAGDRVEVLETGDGGWWKGRCHGKEGLFPVNYVKTL